jgi:glycine cleavage system regulatory protein
MAEFNLEMEELKRAFLTSHQQMEKEFNERMKKSIEQDQQQRTTMASVPIMGNMKSGILNQVACSEHEIGIYSIVCYFRRKNSSANLQKEIIGIRTDSIRMLNSPPMDSQPKLKY